MYGNEFWGNYLFEIYVICLIYLFFRDRDKRRLIVYPSVILMVVMINPFFYWKISAPLLEHYGYSRDLWMLPVIPVISMTLADIFSDVRSWITAAAVSAISIAAFRTVGGYVYTFKNASGGYETGFSPCKNLYKLPQEAVDIDYYLRQMDQDPKIIADTSISTYIRLIDPEVKTAWGRNNTNSGDSSVYLANKGEDFDWDKAYYLASMEGYEFYVTSDPDTNSIENAGFRYIESVSGYNIYRIKCGEE